MKTRLQILSIVSAICISCFIVSCDGILDAELEDVLTEDENYQSDFDSRAAALGVAGQFQELIADQYVLFGELRADLLDVTDNADEYLRQLSTHQVEADNPYIDPSGFYKVILSCNDAMYNMLQMKDLLSNFDRDYSEVAAFRSWCYYLLAVHYGEVPYITEPVDDVDQLDLDDYPVLSLDAMIDSLAYFMGNKVPSLSMVDWGVALDDYEGINRAFVDKSFFYGDLLLWQGDYLNAAMYYKEMMDNTNSLGGVYKCKCTYYYFGYDFEEGGDFEWAEMFETYADGLYMGNLYNEWRWYSIIDQRFEQTNSYVKYFSNNYGDYLLKPSDLSIDNWESQYLINGTKEDLRGNGASWTYEGGMPVVNKYLLGVESAYDNDADIYLYRTGTLHLRYAEAVNRLGKCDLALAILNPDGSLAEDSVAMDTSTTVVTSFGYSVYDFSQIIDKSYKKPLYRSDVGVRGRCYVAPVELPGDLETLQDSILYIEEIISQEYALELAYEGDRWQTLMRIAQRRIREGEDGVEFLADAIAKKFETSGGDASGVKERLNDTNNWFLPLE